MNAAITVWHKHMRKLLGNPEESMGMLIQPVLWVVLFGIGMKALFKPLMPGGDDLYLAFMVPGIIVLSALNGAIGGGAVWLHERTVGIIKEYLVAPIPRLSVLAGNALSIVTKSSFQALVILGVAMLMGVGITGDPIGWLAGILLLVGFGIGFAGVALAAASKADTPGAYHMMIVFFNLPLLFLSNALYPLDTMPRWMEIGARMNPVSYVVDGLRQTILEDGAALAGGEALSLPLCFLATGIFAVLGMWLGYVAFKRAIE